MRKFITPLLIYFTFSLFGCEGVAIVGGGTLSIPGHTWTWGSYADVHEKSRERSIREINYRSSWGNIVKIKDTENTPTTVSPGETVELKTSYYVLGPNPRKKFRIKETRIVKYNDEPVMLPLVRKVKKEQGLTSSIAKLRIPEDAELGEFEVITVIDNGLSKNQSASNFYVQKI